MQVLGHSPISPADPAGNSLQGAADLFKRLPGRHLLTCSPMRALNLRLLLCMPLAWLHRPSSSNKAPAELWCPQPLQDQLETQRKQLQRELVAEEQRVATKAEEERQKAALGDLEQQQGAADAEMVEASGEDELDAFMGTVAAQLEQDKVGGSAPRCPHGFLTGYGLAGWHGRALCAILHVLVDYRHSALAVLCVIQARASVTGSSEVGLRLCRQTCCMSQPA